MIATNAGQAAVAAGLLARRARNGRTVKPCGSGSPMLEPTPGVEEPGGMVAKKPGTPGRARSSRKTIAQGMPDVSVP
jgi:hypothetical protein